MRQRPLGRGFISGLASVLAVLWAALFAHSAAAQSQPQLPTQPPVVQVIDRNAIDLLTGKPAYRLPLLSIGPEGRGGLQLELQFNGVSPGGWTTNLNGAETPYGYAPDWGTVMIAVGSHSDGFYAVDGSCVTACIYASNYGDGSSLSVDSTGRIFTYTVSDGTVYTFNDLLGAPNNNLAEIDYPTGEKVYYNYSGGVLRSVTNSTGYGIHFDYGPGGNGYMQAATAYNMAVEYCSPTATTCSFTQTWPHATFGSPGFAAGYQQPSSATDADGRTTTFGYTNYNDLAPYYLTSIRRPSGLTETLTYSYGPPPCDPTKSTCYGLTAVSYSGGGTWTYSSSTTTNPDGSFVRTTTITDPLQHSRSIAEASSNTCAIMSSETDELGRTTSYLCDGYRRITQVTLPEGGVTTYTYDNNGGVTRGNVVQVTKTPKPGSSLPAINIYANYDTTCTYANKCNHPNSIIDARGNETDYTYDNNTGLLLETQGPAVGGIRPTTVNNYALLTTYGAGLGSAGQVFRQIGTATCASSAATVTPSGLAPTVTCGQSDKVFTTTDYSGASGASNGLPTSTTTGGDNTASATTTTTYDNYGNVLTVVGPLGAAQMTQNWYDLARQKTGVVGPDPDGGNQLLNRARKIQYNSEGLVIETDQGTTNGYVDPNGAGFTPLIQRVTGYDSLDRKIREQVSGGTTSTLTEYSYDAADRLLCTAVRMNPALFSSTTDACTLTAAGSYGSDRITQNTYDAAGEILKITTGLGTSVLRDEKTIVAPPACGASPLPACTPFSGDGLPQAVKDGNGNVSTYLYDGFDRLSQLQYPTSSSVGAGTSSTSDYEGFGYDPAGNLTSHRLRDNTTIAFTYDALNRKWTKTPPEAANAVTYLYDNLGHLKSEATSSQSLSFTYDALGRRLTQTGPLGTVQSAWDVAGRRTKLTWPDNFYIQYTYDSDGEMVNVEENGATSNPGLLATFSYDNLGGRYGITRGNGVSTDLRYDGLERLTTLRWSSSSNNQSFTLAYDPANEIVGQTTTNGAFAWIGPAAATTPYVPNGQNQYTSAGSSPFSYDGRANLATTSSGGGVFSYDSENRLTALSGAAPASLAYSPDGSLWQTSAGTTTTRFLYDGDTIIGEYNGSNSLIRRYVPGPAIDEPLVWYEGAGTTDRRWLMSDHQDSVIAWADGLGNIPAANINTYDEYGQPGPSNTGRFQYTGQAWLPEVAAYDYRARNYLPSIGRFMQADPKGYDAGLNLYAYVGDDPVDHVDPTGMTRQCSGGGNGGASVFCDARGDDRATADDDSQQLASNDKLQPGPHARESIPASGPKITPEEQRKINELGSKHGCHLCGTRNPGTKSGSWVGDHQDPNALNKGDKAQRLYPSCLRCQRVQGGQVRQAVGAQRATAARPAPQVNSPAMTKEQLWNGINRAMMQMEVDEILMEEEGE